MNEVQINIETVLIDYDIPQLFIGIDQVGTKYICLLVVHDENTIRYLAKTVSSDEISELLKNDLDLAVILQDSVLNRWYYTEIESENKLGPLQYQKRSEIPDEYWPDPGVVIKLPEIEDQNVIRDAVDKGTTVVGISIEETPGSHKVSSNVLGLALTHFQGLIKYAYKRALQGVERSQRELLSGAENFTLNAYATGKGSFKVYLESSSGSNLFGENNITYALQRIDELFVTDVQEGLSETLRKNKGHTVNHLKKLLQIVDGNSISIAYDWVDPSTIKYRKKNISRRYARDVLLILDQTSELEDKIVEETALGKEKKVLTIGIIRKIQDD